MSRSIEFEPEASLALAHPANWYEDPRSNFGIDFLDVVDGTVTRIAQRRVTGRDAPVDEALWRTGGGSFYVMIVS